MPHIFDYDLHRTHSYIPKISLEPYLPPEFVQSFRDVESRYIHEGQIIDHSYVTQERIERAFQPIGLDCLLNINEHICPRFILEFFHEIKVKRIQDNSIHLTFSIDHYGFALSLEEFAQILGIPCHGQCAYSEDPELNSLFENRECEGPYVTYIPSQTELINSLCNSSDTFYPDKIRVCELRQFLQPMAVIQRENALGLVKDRNCIPSCVAHMLYCILTRQPYNLAYLFAMRFMHLKDDDRKSMPYGMLLTRVYNFFMSNYPYLQNDQYNLVVGVLEPITEYHVTRFVRPIRTSVVDRIRRIKDD